MSKSQSPKKQPWFKFYPTDWRGDAKLRMCSIAARGLWAEMICIMHEAEPYGHLVVNGQPVSTSQMATLAGISARECAKLTAELGAAGVFTLVDGVITSRRMVRDKAKEAQDRENGKGGGNPKLLDEDKGGVNPPDKGEDKAQIPEARDQSDSRSETREGGRALFTEGSRQLADAFLQALGFDEPIKIPPEFAGVPWRAVSWEEAGWPAELIAAEARRIGPSKPISYHEKVFATAFAKQNAPLPVVEVQAAEKINVPAIVDHRGSSASGPSASREARFVAALGRGALEALNKRNAQEQ